MVTLGGDCQDDMDYEGNQGILCRIEYRLSQSRTYDCGQLCGVAVGETGIGSLIGFIYIVGEEHITAFILSYIHIHHSCTVLYQLYRVDLYFTRV